MKFTKLLVLGALLLTCSGVANAEVKDGVRVQPKPAKTQGFVASETTDTYYYLYNVNGQRFFTEGNAWGTQASVGYTGLKVAFTADATYPSAYIFNDYSLAKKSWKMVFFDSKTAMYVDRGSQANYRWAVVQGEGTFRLQAANADNGNPGWTNNGETDPAYEEGKFVGWDAASNSTALHPYLEEGENHFIDWAFVSAEDYDAIAPALELYAAAIPLKEILDKAKEIGADVSAEEDVYLNEASTVEEINAAIKSAEEAIVKREQELASQNYENATVDKPVDVTSLFITNPSYDTNKNDGWKGDTPAFQSYTNAEFYQKVFNTYQPLVGLHEGVYVLGVQGYYRPGGAQDGYTRYTNKDTQIYDVKMYANSISQPIATAYEGAGSAKVGTGNESEVTTADGSKIYIPNDMNSAAAYFKADRYHNAMLFEANADTITIGLKNSKSIGSNWVCYDNWTLTYYGSGEDAYAELAKNIATTLPDYSNLAEGTIFTQSVMDAYTEAKAAMSTATGKDGIKAAIAAAQEAAAAIELNIELWKKYEELCLKAEQVGANEDYNELAREGLEDYKMDLDDAKRARTMTNEELQSICNEIEDRIDKAVRAPKENADVTSYLVNPDFSTNDDTGWTGRNTITDIAHSCAEAYEKKNFDFYQIVKDAPLGVYEISLKGFFRNGSNDVAWAAYRDQGAPEATAFVYMNGKQTPLKNCYDYKFPASAFDLSSDHLYGPTPYPLLTAAGDSLVNESGESLWVPNGMSTSQDVFDQGYYMSSAFGLVAKEGDEMRVGIKGSLGSSCWAIWDDFRLTYRGFKKEVVLEVLNEEIANTEKYKSLLIGKNVRDIIDTKLAAAVAAREFEKGQDMFGALTDLFTVGDTVRASEAIFASLQAAYEKLDPAISVSEASDEVYQKARSLQNSVYDEVLGVEPSSVTWTDAKATETIAEIEQMIKELAKPAGFADATDENPKDANWCIVNPIYADNTNEGWTSTKTPGLNKNLCEIFNSDFNYYQDIQLTAGTYDLTAPGFYRYGSTAEDYTEYTADPTQNNNLVMYVTVGSDSISAAMPRLASCAQAYVADATEASDGTKSYNAMTDYAWVADPVVAEDSLSATGYIVANTMGSAATEFISGNYTGTKITFKVPEDMTVRIGMSKAVQQANNWCIWGGWKLTYYGKNSTKEVTPTGITAAFGNGQVARTEFYNLSGARINAPQRGVVIIKQIMADGTVKVRKAVLK